MDAYLVTFCLGESVLAFISCLLLVGGGRGAARSVAGVPSAHALFTGILRRVPALGRLRRQGETRRRRMVALRQLPVMIDILALGLSAGLSFDASLELYCQRYQTELAAALSEAMMSWRLGAQTREDALHALADELDVVALKRFAAAVSQALAFGSPLSRTLERQANIIRDEQRSETEAEIERAPVKMLIPLGTLIVPAMLLAILGPLLGSSIVLG